MNASKAMRRFAAAGIVLLGLLAVMITGCDRRGHRMSYRGDDEYFVHRPPPVIVTPPPPYVHHPSHRSWHR